MTKVYLMLKSQPVSYPEAMVEYNNMLAYIRDEVVRVVGNWINLEGKVPKRTGQLRDTLTATLNSSTVENNVLKIKLGSMVSYATEVNDMPAAVVRHVRQWGKAYYYTHATGTHWIMLNDPFAIGHFWNALQIYTEGNLINISQRAIDEYFKGTGKLMRSVRKGLTFG